MRAKLPRGRWFFVPGQALPGRGQQVRDFSRFVLHDHLTAPVGNERKCEGDRCYGTEEESSRCAVLETNLACGVARIEHSDTASRPCSDTRATFDRARSRGVVRHQSPNLEEVALHERAALALRQNFQWGDPLPGIRRVDLLTGPLTGPHIGAPDARRHGSSVDTPPGVCQKRSVNPRLQS